MSLERSSARMWVTGLVVGLSVLIGAACLLAMPQSRKPVDDYIAQTKAAGRPVTLREVVGPDPAPETNGLVDVEAADKWLDEHKGLPETWTVVGPWTDGGSRHWSEGLTDAQRREFDEFIADAKPFFDGVAAGLAKPRLRTTGADDGPVLGAGDVLPRIRVIQALAARAVVASKPEDRLDSVELLAKLAVRSESRTMLDDFVASTAMKYATLGVRLALERGDVDPEVWRARLDGLLGDPWLSRFGDAVRRGRANLLDVLRTADLDGPIVVSSERIARDRFRAAFERISDRLEAFRRGESMPDGSPAAMARALEATERFETAATSPYARLHADLKASIGPSQRGSASWAMLSPLLRSAEMLAQTEAVCRLARIALAAAERRAKSGKLPASLDELKDAFPEGVPVDPFTDAPFVYEATETGVRISTSGHLPGESAPEGRRAPEAGFTWELKR